MIKKFLQLAVALVSTCTTFSQATIKANEAAQIKYGAEILITRNLKDLLNTISNSEIDPKDLNDVITNSYTESYSRVFDSSVVVVEDDIDPSHTGKSLPHSDVDVKNYLNHLDTWYTKSPSESIVFTLEKVSNIKQFQKNIYVKVYFTSYFRNKSKLNDTPYTANNRVAEVIVRKKNNFWVSTIGSIRFFNPQDTVNDVDNDMVIERDPKDQTLDSIALANGQKTFEQELIEKQRNQKIEKDKEINENFDKLIEDAEKDRKINDFADALQKYNKAKELKPYDRYVLAQINSVRSEMDKAKLGHEQLFNDYLTKARQAKARRSFADALAYYRKAKNEDPTKFVSFESELSALDKWYSFLETMDEYYKIGKYKDAIDEYSKRIKKSKGEKDYSDYFNGRGKCYEQTNDISKALKDYTTAIELDGDNVDALINRATLLKKKGTQKDFIAAIADHQAAIRVYNENPLNYLELSNIRVLANQYKEAIEILDEGLKVEALQKNTELYFQRGLLLANAKSWNNAISDFKAVVELDSNYATGYYNRGLCYLQQLQVSNAASDFEKARRKGLDSVSINIISGLAENYFQRAATKFATSATDSAIVLIDDAIDINPYNDKYWYNKGEYFFALLNYDKAIQFYKHAVQINKAHADAWNRMALSYYLLGDYKTSVENYQKAIALIPNYIMAIKGLADSYFALNEFSNAITQYESAIKLITGQKNSDNELAAQVYNSLGKSYHQNNQFEPATAALKNAIKKKDNFPEAYFNRGLSYYQLGKLEDAISDFQNAVQREDNHLNWNYYLAKAYQENKNYPQATIYYTKTMALDTNHVFKGLVLNRGKSFYDAKDFNSALKDYQEARNLNLDTAKSDFNYELGIIYLNLGQSDPALECFEKQDKSEGNNGMVAYGMGSAYVLKGKFDEALPWFEKALQSKSVSARTLKNDKTIEAIHDNKSFKSLLKKY